MWDGGFFRSDPVDNFKPLSVLFFGAKFYHDHAGDQPTTRGHRLNRSLSRCLSLRAAAFAATSLARDGTSGVYSACACHL